MYTFLSSMGVVSSKKEAEALARDGKITVDDSVMKSLDYQINPRKQIVKVNGKEVELKENRIYYVFNKPLDIVCSKKEIIEFFDLPSDLKNSISPVGQLDKNATGLLIVTNDGRLSRQVLVPQTKRWKTYEVVLDKEFKKEDAEQLEKGVEIETEINDRKQKYITMPAKLKIMAPKKIHLSIMEGKKHQVKKMVTKVGYWVESLKRISIAKLKLGTLKPGKYKEYDKEEIYRLLFE
jgi:pseudouridine synthase